MTEYINIYHQGVFYFYTGRMANGHEEGSVGVGGVALFTLRQNRKGTERDLGSYYKKNQEYIITSNYP